MSLRIPLAFALALATYSAAPSFVQENVPPVVKLTFDKKAAPAGSKLRGTVIVTFAEGLHGYQNPPLSQYQIPVKVECETKGVTFRAAYPSGIIKTAAGEQAAVYEGATRILIEITLPKKPGTIKPKLFVSYQQCNETACFPPGKVQVEGSVTVTKAIKGRS